jgi:hypothetical protein
MKKPKLFIGSSREGLEVCDQVAYLLDDIADIDLWSKSFPLMRGTLERLEELSTSYDFAIMIFSPDDIRTSRQRTSNVPRDNVIFELGLFMGSIGRDRTLALAEYNVSLPSDFHGVTLPKYHADEFKRDPNQALKNSYYKIRNQILQFGTKEFNVAECKVEILSPLQNAYMTKGEFTISGSYGKPPPEGCELWTFSFDDSSSPKKYCTCSEVGTAHFELQAC